MQASTTLKDGTVQTYSVLQNTTNYQVRLAQTAKGLWVCIEQSVSQWKLTISEQLITQTILKVSGGKVTMGYKEFYQNLLIGLKKINKKWSVGVMTPVQLELLRGGDSTKQTGNTKLYLILSDTQNRMHYPFTFQLSNMGEKQKLQQAIKKMKLQLEQLKGTSDKSQTSFSLLSESTAAGQQIRIQNQQLKKKIKMYQDSLTQKRGAVEIDMILKQKNILEMQAETKKRQEIKQITKLKGIHQILERQVIEVRNQVDLINKQLLLLEDSVSNPAKLKSHALRVLKGYEVDLRNSKKVLVKQTKQIDTLKRNINNTKNNQRKLLTKIKQIQAQIQQAKKKANIKEISNRLHSPAGSKQPSSMGGSSKEPSIVSKSDGKSGSNSGIKNNNRNNNNLVRQNLLKRASDLTNSKQKNNLLKTTPMIQTPTQQTKKNNQYRPPVRPVVSSHQVAKSPARQTYQPRNTSIKSQSGNSSIQKKKQQTPIDKERQKLAIDRLMGGRKKQIQTKPLTQKRQVGQSLNSKPNGAFGKRKTDSSKDILNRMKQIKAQYNNRSQNNNNKVNAFANKVAELVSKK